MATWIFEAEMRPCYGRSECHSRFSGIPVPRWVVAFFPLGVQRARQPGEVIRQLGNRQLSQPGPPDTRCRGDLARTAFAGTGAVLRRPGAQGRGARVHLGGRRRPPGTAHKG